MLLLLVLVPPLVLPVLVAAALPSEFLDGTAALLLMPLLLLRGPHAQLLSLLSPLITMPEVLAIIDAKL